VTAGLNPTGGIDVCVVWCAGKTNEQVRRIKETSMEVVERKKERKKERR
jgi:hypothetical protein